MKKEISDNSKGIKKDDQRCSPRLRQKYLKDYLLKPSENYLMKKEQKMTPN